jgi:ubiquinone biosynthesis protein
MSERVGPRAFIHGIRDNAPLWMEKMPDLPNLIHAALTQVKSQEHQHKQTIIELQNLRIELKQSHQKQIIAITGSILLISGSVILALEPIYTYNMTALGTIFGVSGLSLLLLTWSK